MSFEEALNAGAAIYKIEQRIASLEAALEEAQSLLGRSLWYMASSDPLSAEIRAALASIEKVLKP